LKAYVRIWQEVELSEIKNNLLVAGTLSGDCFACKAIGLDYYQVKVCPNCKREFKYLALRNQASGSLIKRLKQKRPDLLILDFPDFKAATESQAAKELLK
jgi:hypothetical protein